MDDLHGEDYSPLLDKLEEEKLEALKNVNPIKVEVWLQKLSQPIKLSAKATYQKGDMFCIEWVDDKGVRMVDKYPIESIFRVRETY
ncbi:hypothetical protein N9391_01145 [Gammaproteobacteria bacterium]|nr:hypothetical protein [Gammaproteobacteria bacterium]